MKFTYWLKRLNRKAWLLIAIGIAIFIGVWTVWDATHQPSLAKTQRQQACERAAKEPHSGTEGISTDEAICKGLMSPEAALQTN